MELQEIMLRLQEYQPSKGAWSGSPMMWKKERER